MTDSPIRAHWTCNKILPEHTWGLVWHRMLGLVTGGMGRSSPGPAGLARATQRNEGTAGTAQTPWPRGCTVPFCRHQNSFLLLEGASSSSSHTLCAGHSCSHKLCLPSCHTAMPLPGPAPRESCKERGKRLSEDTSASLLPTWDEETSPQISAAA